MNKIENYSDLLVEKKRLESLLIIQKEIVQNDILMLRKEIQPTIDLLQFMSKLTTKGRTNGFVTAGVDIIGDFLLKNILLAKSGWLVRLVIPFLVKNYSNHELAKDGTGLLAKLVSVITRVIPQKSH
jgi:hypothetical protein